LADASAYQRRTPETTILYRVVQQHLETFLASAREQGLVVPRFVERELRAYLTCGIHTHGFLRVRCDDCGRERLVAFSCKTRSLCPSCGARRMSDTAAHLVDRVFPEVPVRQYVLSLPFALRIRVAFDQTLCSDVLRIFMRSVFASLRRRARKTITATLARRVARLLANKGLLGEHAATEPDPMETHESLLPQLYSASVQGRIASGPHAGQRLLRPGDRIDAEGIEAINGPRCASVQGFSLHADVCVPARDRRRLERLCRYVARPPIASNRLSEAPDGRIVYCLRHRWRDGTTHVVFDPLDLVARLAAVVPPPRANLVRYFGVLAPCASWRDVVVRDRHEMSSLAQPPPSCPCRTGPAAGRVPARPAFTQDPFSKDGGASPPLRKPTSASSEQGGREAALPPHEGRGPSRPAPLHPRRLTWAQLLRRVFAVDAFQCECGGRMRILAAIDQPEVARAILDCLGLSSRAPPLAPPSPPGPTDLELGFEEPREPWPGDAT
jgi:ribosomal protein S27E